jgi:hypothetical protein
VPYDAVEKQVEPKLEGRLRARVSRLEVVLDMIDEMRELVGRQLLQERGREDPEVLLRPVLHPTHPQAEADDVAVEDVVSLVRQLRRESGTPQCAEHPLHVPKPRHAAIALRQDEAGRPRMANEDLVR